MSVATKRRLVVDEVAHRHCEVGKSLNHRTCCRGHVEITVGSTQVEDIVFSHLLHLGLINQLCGHARCGCVAHRSTAHIVKRVVKHKIFILRHGICCHKQKCCACHSPFLHRSLHVHSRYCLFILFFYRFPINISLRIKCAPVDRNVLKCHVAHTALFVVVFDNAT